MRDLNALPVLVFQTILLFASIGASAAPQVLREENAASPTVVDLTVSEGTAMSLDTSPDGRWLVFDLLGSIYRIPVEGGRAEPLTVDDPSAINYHPAWSPDGRQIAFVSDRSGQLNLWIMNSDGSDARPVVLDDASRFAHPRWMPDGREVVVTRIFGVPGIAMEKRDLRLWKYSLETGTGTELAGSDRVQTSWPAVTPDGRHVYYESSSFIPTVAGSPHTQYHIERLELPAGRTEHITRPQTTFRPPSLRIYRMEEFAPPDSFAPELSPDGRFLAFARRIPGGQTEVSGHAYDARTALWIRDLESGVESVLLDPIDPDRTETYARAVLRVANGYAWAKDGSSLFVPVNGKIRRVAFPSGDVQTVPFEARVHRRLQPKAEAHPEIASETYTPAMVQWPAYAPNTRSLVVQAAGHLWIRDANARQARRLVTLPDHVEHMPAWSPDGNWIAFVTWHDHERGHVWKIRPDGTGLRRLSDEPGEYFHPAWSPDSSHLVITQGSDETARGNAVSANTSWRLRTLPAAGGTLKTLARASGPEPAQWASDNRIYVLEPVNNARHSLSADLSSRVGGNARILLSVDHQGRNSRVHAVLPPTTSGFSIAPDLRKIITHSFYELYVGILGDGDEPAVFDYTVDSAAHPLTKVTSGGGWFPTWADASTLRYVNAGKEVTLDLTAGETDSREIGVSLRRNFAPGAVALVGGTIIPGPQDQPARQGTVVIESGWITCVFECDVSEVPTRIDVTGKFIMPGIVDVHDHNHLGSFELSSRHHAHSALQLAFGVTTVVDPYGHPLIASSLSDLTATGQVIGPRYLYTGLGIHGEAIPERIGSLDDARQLVAAQAATGAIGIKQFHVTSRRESRLLAQATREHGGLYLTAEQGDLPYVISLALDGYSGWEHMLSYDTLHDDAAQWFGRAGITYSPTLIVGGLNYWGAEYFYSRHRPSHDAKFDRFMPWQWSELYDRPAHRERSAFAFPFIAEGVAAIRRAGGNAAIGAHGEAPGLGAHFEMQIYGSAMPAKEVIHMATVGGARYIGAYQDIGSIEPGKIADLIVLNSDPIARIENTLDIEFVMTQGNLHEAETLNRIFPSNEPYGPVPWRPASDIGPRMRPLDHWDD